MTPSRAVLITGCSTGIGRATAQHLAGRGWTVYATARRPDSIADLRDRGCRTLALDVTDEDSMAAAVGAVTDAEGAVGVLVNNAGYSQSGAVESVPMDRARAQFETNVFGLLRMCQLTLPGMREQGWGKVVNIGSMGGRFTFPGGGLYHATKYALEALSDALRFEVRGFGVDVVLIEPGSSGRTSTRRRWAASTPPTRDRTAPSTRPSPSRPPTPMRGARWPGSAAARKPSPARSRRPSPRRGREPATR
jgi:NAD(P)-dependent dehydrogenase (short-subunit alcohol dehydrogenase family)